MNYKVCYIFFHCLGESLNTEFDYSFSENVNFKRTIPPLDDTTWKEWLGLQWEDIVTSNAVIEVKLETQNPKVLDSENEKIALICRYARVSLMLTGSFAMDNAYFLTGSIIDDEVDIRQFFKYDRWFHSGDNFVQTLDDSYIEVWQKLFDMIRSIHSDEKNYRRLMRGIMCFQKACSESSTYFRLPYFVRSLEALILPELGNTTKRFKSRVSQFSLTLDIKKPSSQNISELLGDIYNLRCIFDHLHEIRDDSELKDLLLCFQCEQLARNAYQCIMLNPDILKKFITDEEIKKYWNVAKGENDVQ